MEYNGIDHDSPERRALDIERHNELVAMGYDEFIVSAEQYRDLDYMDGLVARIREKLGVRTAALDPEEAARRRALRQQLYEELELIDGVHWNGLARERARRAAAAGSLGAASSPDDGWDVVPVEAYGL